MASGLDNAWLADADSFSGRRRKGVFEDIVEDRRVNGDLFWVLRTRHGVPHPAFGQQQLQHQQQQLQQKSRDALKLDVLRSDKLLYGLREIHLETGRSMAELVKEAEAVLEEMAHNLSMFSIRSFGFAVAKVMKRIYRGVFVNTEGVARLRKASSEYPVILMPMHRSYADFLLVSLICFDYNLPMPAIASAMDFMGMKFIGSVLRNCGAFFIRRSFATDRVYWLTFVEYVKTHVRDGLHPVEFFIEGTRSRTGKPLYPKTGMLGAILESWFMCEVPDVYLVPVSISYDRILEETLYAYELLGVPKPKESTSGLLKARALLSEVFGSVHVYFDEPISLRKFAETHGEVDRAVHSLAPKVKAQLTEAEARMLKSAARHVVSRHCANAVVSPFCLMAALLAETGQPEPSLPLAQLAADLPWLRRQLEDVWGVRIDWPSSGEEATVDSVIADQCRLHCDLVQLLGSGGGGGMGKDSAAAWVSVSAPATTTPGDSPTELRVLERAAIGLRLASYRNHLMCHLAGPALALAVASRGFEAPAKIYDTLKRLMHREFATLPDEMPQLLPQLQFNSSSSSSNDGRLGQFLLAQLRPFLTGYWLVCDTLLAKYRQQLASSSSGSAATLTDRQLAAAVQARALDRVKAGGSNGGSQWLGWDCASLDLLSNAVHGLRRMRVLGDGGGVGVADWDAKQLAELAELLESLIGKQSDSICAPSSPSSSRPKL